MTDIGLSISEKEYHNTTTLQNPVGGRMKITHVVTSVNDNPKYTRFIPLFLKAWTTFYPDIKPLIIYVGDSPLNEFVDSVVRVLIDKTISTVFASQTTRCLYPSLLDPESIVLISDIDMLPANSTYFTSNMSRLRYDNFVSYRPLSVVDNRQIAMCYVMATAKTWKDTFKINDIDDINIFLKKYSRVNFDGIHGGNGWFTDQEILYDYLINKGQKHAVEFLSDAEAGYNRLDFYSHNYDKDTFISMLKSGRYSDAHIYAHECPWTVDDILYITSLL